MPDSITDVRDKLRAVDIVFTIDTTGSMEPSISEVRTKLQAFAQELAKSEVAPRLAFGIVAYRDHPPEDTTYVTQVFQISADVVHVQKELGKLSATGGGDGPEAVLDGLHDALNKIKWREHSHNVIVLVGDAPPHGTGSGGDHWPKGCPCGLTIEKITKQAEQRAATIFAVGVGNDAQMRSCFQKIAKPTGGEFVSLSDVRSLIPKILELLRQEMGKVAADIDVFDGWSRGMSTDEISRTTGKSRTEIDESIKRLRAKGVMTLDPSRTADFDRFLSRGVSTSLPPAPPIPEVDRDLLDQIKIGEPIRKTDKPPEESGDINIVIHDA